MTSAPTIAFDYRPSRALAAAALVVVVAALAVITASALAPALQGVLALAVLVIAVGGLRRFLRPPFRRIAWRSDGWLLVDAAGNEHAALLTAQRRLAALVALEFRCASGGMRFHPLLAPDNLDRDTHRRLLLLLARAEVAHPA